MTAYDITERQVLTTADSYSMIAPLEEEALTGGNLSLYKPLKAKSKI